MVFGKLVGIISHSGKPSRTKYRDMNPNMQIIEWLPMCSATDDRIFLNVIAGPHEVAELQTVSFSADIHASSSAQT